MVDKVKQGKANRRKGKEFENKVQAALESEGWIVMRFTKKVENGILVNCKPRFNPFTRSIQSFQTGFPDFLCVKNTMGEIPYWIVRLVECKINGYCDKEEKEQIKFLNKLGFHVEIAYNDNGKIRYKQALAES